MANPPLKIFISYSHRDELLRDELVSHISLLKRQGLIETWYDRKVSAGDHGDAEIDANLESADIVLLLVSADFINSMYCWEKELERGLERHEAKEAVVIPIVVRAVDLEGVSFGYIQSLPTDRKPITSWANRDEAWADVARGLRNAIVKLQERRSRFREPSVTEKIGRVLESSRADSAKAEGEVYTGYKALDDLLAGLRPAELVIVGSRPCMGKTALACSIAMNAAFGARGKSVTVGIFSLETARTPLVMRMIAATARVDSNSLRAGSILDEEWQRINMAVNVFKHAPLFIDDAPRITMAELKSKALRLKAEHGLGLVVIDHLQLLDIDAGQSVKADEARSRIARELRELARLLNIPVLVTSQLSRKIDQRTEKRPSLSDLPEGYDIDVHADVVLLLFREEFYDPDTPRRDIADIIVAKQRNGPCGELQLVFSPKHGTFDNLIHESEFRFSDLSDSASE